jgi:hypothetical protein
MTIEKMPNGSVYVDGHSKPGRWLSDDTYEYVDEDGTFVHVPRNQVVEIREGSDELVRQCGCDTIDEPWLGGACPMCGGWIVDPDTGHHPTYREAYEMRGGCGLLFFGVVIVDLALLAMAIACVV